MILLMTVIGAITRLTESGLSITEWNVVMGWLPPLGDEAWALEFSKYKASPEFELKHFWMQVDDFKQIFFWEWLHRLWGRLIGLAFIVPLIVFGVRGQIPRSIRPHLILLFLLGLAQGYMGWYMVQSGLVDRPSVSHYRLAAHLSLALIIYSVLLWAGLRLWTQKAPAANANAHAPRPHRVLIAHGFAALALVAVTIVWGAFVAGLDAGLIYNEFPFMGANLIPPEMWAHSPKALNLVENHASVQFTHRWLGITTGLMTLAYAWIGFRQTRQRLFLLVGGWVLVQIGLGITTLLSQVWIPVAVLHQFGAVVLLSLVIASLQAAIPARCKMPA
jgi:cytochrome c oxidase assembly protein subunit 15